ncbi:MULTISPECIES: aldehyde dehydrogenase family protein [Streptomyces]|uniref:aldehyde dehydrogenase family protein n=1 Tax=Streptomyces TaxID=1883 RepID=UPI002248CF34|nr:aldehyde dehydrogenase family protein [Streptomyces sp. JHD 1]MCX2968597.1 aldehyde dehydrogenase family protein [Streptomyces sp. JHD 1]
MNTPPTPAADNSVISRNPADPGDILVALHGCGPDTANRAVRRAARAQSEWLAGGATARSAALRRAGDAVESASEELAGLLVREVGKPLAEARGEVARTVAIWRYYAQLPYDATGSVHEPASGPGLLLTRRRPHGVAGLITPWNFPMAIPSWKAAPALAAGNTVVLKPAPEATACALRLAEIIKEVLPADVLHVIPGGAEVGAALTGLADVVSFTGSTAVGAAVARAAATRGVPAQAEMGGHNAAVVLPDANMGKAAADIAAAIAGYAGQKCTATRRVIAVGSALPRLREALAEALRELPARDPRAADAVCGPVISEVAKDRVLRARDSALSTGARALAGGERRGPGTAAGWYVDPVLLEDVPAGHELHDREVFGPIAVLSGAVDFDEAVQAANSGHYGLVASLHTGDLQRALSAVDRLATGMLRVNAPTTGVDFHLPFGGEKGSSYGMREQGHAAMDFYTSSRTVSLLPAASA